MANRDYLLQTRNEQLGRLWKSINAIGLLQSSLIENAPFLERPEYSGHLDLNLV